MTLLLVPITAATYDASLADVEQALAAGADGVELRLDCMSEVSDEQVVRLCAQVPEDRTILLTIRGRAEGGEFDGSEQDRVARLIELGPQVQWIDFEHAAWQRSANIQQKIMLAVRRARYAYIEEDGSESIDHPGRRRLVLSRHYAKGRPATLTADLMAMLDTPAADIVKIAWLGRTIRDNFEAFDLLRDAARPMIVTVMGEHGLLSRVLAKKFNAAAAFAALSASRASAPGQLTLHELRSLYNGDSHTPHTQVFGVIGDPVAHSIGPAVHNAAFVAAGRDAVYLPMLVNAGYESFKAFMVEALARSWLDLRGLSITAPHKRHALRFVQEHGGDIDSVATRAGAVNTLRVDEQGRLSATNTDVPAVVGALCDAMHLGPADLRGRTAAIIGSGGAARACAAGLGDCGALTTIYARNVEHAAVLARDIGCRAESLDHIDKHDAEILINATPLGQRSPVSSTVLRAGMTVFDTVYRPIKTQLLRDAEAAGCRTVKGLDMFLRQAAMQFKYWTGSDAHEALMHSVAMQVLTPMEPDSINP